VNASSCTIWSVTLRRFVTRFFPWVLGATLWSPVASAQVTNTTSEEKARILFESGKAARDAKDLAEALRLFRQSHETYASPSNEALVHMADCENALGKTAAAYLHYTEYLRNTKAPAERIAEVTNIVSTMAKAGPWIRFARRDLLDAKTIVRIDGIPLSAVNGKVEDIPAETGNHFVTILEPGKAERTVVVKVDAGQHAIVDFRPKVLPNGGNGLQPVGPETPKPLPHWVLPLGIVVGGAGAVSTLVMGAGFAGAATKENKTNPRESDRLATNATGLFIAGGVLTTATVVMIVVNQHKKKDMAFLPLPLPGGGGASLIGQF
jgi:hypothetical protein